MTTLAAFLGAVPRAIGFGEGAELRHPLGIAIVGGLIVSQMLTLLTNPASYLALDRFRSRSPRELLVTTSLAACTVGPNYRRPATVASVAPAAWKAAPGWVPAQPSDDKPRGGL